MAGTSRTNATKSGDRGARAWPVQKSVSKSGWKAASISRRRRSSSAATRARTACRALACRSIMASRPPTAAMVRARNLDERASSGVRPVSTFERQRGQPARSGAHSRYCARQARWKSCLQHDVLKGSCGGFIELRGGVGAESTSSMQMGHCSSSACSCNNGGGCRCCGVRQVSGEGRGGERHCAEERGERGGGVPGASGSCAAAASPCRGGVAGHEMELDSRIPAGDAGGRIPAGDAGDSTATLRVTLYSVRGGEADREDRGSRTLRRPEREDRGSG
eukprot:scaffold3051_cov65-Phaeocystis_antarctica.AAC.1